MKNTAYIVTTTLLIVFFLMLVNVAFGKEINSWMATSIREAKIEDLFYLGLVFLALNSFSRPTPPSA